MIQFFRFSVVLAAFCLCRPVFGQDKPDTTKVEKVIESIKDGKVSQRIMKSITRKSRGNPMGAVKSEDAFIPFEGKIIRKIHTRHIGFDKTVYDTTRNIQSVITRIGNALHSNSKDWLIKDNLFVRENKPLSPFKLADNERYLRDLDFILDARFYVVPLSHTKDSVDLVVLTRDVFSIGGTFNPRNATTTRFKIYDTNLAGWGQRLQFNGLIEDGRNPAFTYEAMYRKNSIAGTFINGTVGYTQLNTGSSYGEEEEKAYYLKLDRPLVSPYTTFAGGMELSKNWSQNFVNKNDTLFKDYRYIVNDFWVGYNIGAKQNGHDRSRHFVALRAFDQKFTHQPLQQRERQSPIYNDLTYVIGGLTFFQQNFYTVRYVYGFGRTEDVPYGHTISLYGGWSRQMGLVRPYFGFEAEKSIVNRSGEFYNVAVKAGGFEDDGFEDILLLLSGSLTSKLIAVDEWLMRQSFSVDYTRIYHQKALMPLDINNEYGLQYFVADSLRGTKRVHLKTETLAFSPWQLLGFRFAPFVFGETALISPKDESIFGNKPYFGFGGGIRTRNENLVFGTVELRFVYFPRTVEDISSFAIKLSSNLRVKYSAGFVRAPSFIRYN
jgi:hypothetical protein